MNKGDWKSELDRLLKTFEQESKISLRKIKRGLKASGRAFNEDFRKYFMKMSTLRLDTCFYTILAEQLNENDNADDRMEINVPDDTNVVNNMNGSHAESNSNDEVDVKREIKVENEIEDEAALPLVAFDPNKANQSLIAANSSIQNHSCSSSKSQGQSKPNTTKRFQCEICAYATSHNFSLKRHQLSHKNGGIKPFKCEQCTFSSRYKSSFIRHRQVHTLQKSMGVQQDRNGLYKCTHCAQRFVKWESLRTHLAKSHDNNQRLFNCKRCMRRFEQKNEKKRHEVRCPYRRYECYLCKRYVTAHIARMQEHLRTHSGVKQQ